MALLATILPLVACAPEVEPLVACAPHGAATPPCGYRIPEDLAALPGGRALLVSEYGDMRVAAEGAIVRLDLATGRRSDLFRAGEPIVAVDPASFATEVVYASDGVTMGAGTVGLQVDGELLVGSFAGDRILRVQLGAAE